ncbi:transglycosylase domain-containing protein [Vannielia litorea]|uniref:transglycosylase domain-containing protein n=1 Tax=Vannielia litorea TaxID=1217970 RepID=UPI001BCBA362|nr:transglycosylase domain-containing protein [Vannielia litorea]MBS8228702.1 hypothetical protein [Vannielia litorea]
MIRHAAAALLLLATPLAAQSSLHPVPPGLEALVVAIVEQRADGSPSTFGPILRELAIKMDDDPANDLPGHRLSLNEQFRLTKEAALLGVALTDSQIVNAWALKTYLGRGCTGFPAAANAFWNVEANEEPTARQIATLSVLSLAPTANSATPQALSRAYTQALTNAEGALPPRISETLSSEGPEPIPQAARCAENP